MMNRGKKPRQSGIPSCHMYSPLSLFCSFRTDRRDLPGQERSSRSNRAQGTVISTDFSTEFWSSTPHQQKPLMPRAHLQDEVYQWSREEPEKFWSTQAGHIHWHKEPVKALMRTTKELKSGVTHDHWSWYPGGEISTTYNCVDRHVFNGKSDSCTRSA